MLGFSRQAFYAWTRQRIGERELDGAYLTDAALAVHGDDPEFGCRFVADELQASGHTAGVAAVLSGADLSTHSRRHGSGKRPGPPVHDDWLERNFAAEAPHRLWSTDITEHWTAEGKPYLCALKDVSSNRIVGYSISDRRPHSPSTP